MLDTKAMQVLNPGDITSNREVQAAIAEIQARFMLAQLPQMKRAHETVATQILSMCSRKEFAENALYNVKVGGKYDDNNNWIDIYDEDFNIRAAEQFMICFGNVANNVVTVHEDSEKRKVAISVTDLEGNITYNDEITLYKTVERKKLKRNQTALSQRETSTPGQIVYIVACTPEELQKKQDAQVSKKIRKMFFRLFPIDLKVRAREAVNATLLSDIKKNIQDRRITMLESFKSLGIGPEQIEEYAGKKISKFDEQMILAMGKIFNGIREGELNWLELMESLEGDKEKAPEFDPEKDLKDVPNAKKPEPEKEKPAKVEKPKKPTTKKETSQPESETTKGSSEEEKPAEDKTPPPPPVKGWICELHGDEECEVCNESQKEPDPTEKPKKEKKTASSKKETEDRILEKLDRIPPNMRREIESESGIFYKSLDNEDRVRSIGQKILDKAEVLIDQFLDEN